MKIVGIVAEYNPFHNGHLYNLQSAKKLSGADACICVMSSNFTQRGIPAIVDKWKRAEMALCNGADLIIELPAIFSSQSAQYFCRSSIELLNSTGVIDYLCFGSEYGHIEFLDKISDILVTETKDFSDSIKEYLKTGISFPKARMLALKKQLAFCNISDIEYNNLETFLLEPNNILGIEYITALKKINSSIKPFTVKRLDAAHNSTEINGNISSASAIRNYIQNSIDFDAVKNSMPEQSWTILEQSIKLGTAPVSIKDFEQLILYKIRTSDVNYIKSIADISEGLENKIKDEALEQDNLLSIINSIKSKRYTLTRIQRILTNILLGLTRDELATVKISGPQYIRVLGFSKTGQTILKEMRKKASLPVLTNFSDKNKYIDNIPLNIIADFECKASSIYTLAYSNTDYRNGNGEFKKHPIIM